MNMVWFFSNGEQAVIFQVPMSYMVTWSPSVAERVAKAILAPQTFRPIADLEKGAAGQTLVSPLASGFTCQAWTDEPPINPYTLKP